MIFSPAFIGIGVYRQYRTPLVRLITGPANKNPASRAGFYKTTTEVFLRLTTEKTYLKLLFFWRLMVMNNNPRPASIIAYVSGSGTTGTWESSLT